MSEGTFHFKAVPAAIRTAQIIGVTSAAALSGYIACFSVVTVPAMQIDSAPPATIAKQWQKAYWIGAGTAPAMAVFSSLSFGYLASQAAKLPKVWYNTSLDPRPSFNLYSAAAVLVPAIVPFTLFIMKDTNAKLHHKANSMSTEVKDDSELTELLPKWKLLNNIRASFPGIAAILGLWAIVSRPDFVGLNVMK
ncbi:DUF1772-domain-containing protein [Tothia fuscella]|uniref:DUF1772-domain-containing protein n=1 Tax=Tothia fuscella TaxID=1048955 RepID=A0A9P4U3N4_9PEZI|nr:DUF1772-domain-containing protein [Tothia fuscella]